MLGEWFEVPFVGFDTYHVGTKIVFFVINEKQCWKFLGINEKKGRISHNIARRFILPCNSKRSEINLREATLIYCLANHIKINFPSLMISHLSDCIEKKFMVGYRGLLMWIFKKFGVPLDSLQFPMSPNNNISVKCLNNLHLRVSEKEF